MDTEEVKHITNTWASILFVEANLLLPLFAAQVLPFPYRKGAFAALSRFIKLCSDSLSYACGPISPGFTRMFTFFGKWRSWPCHKLATLTRKTYKCSHNTPNDRECLINMHYW